MYRQHHFTEKEKKKSCLPDSLENPEQCERRRVLAFTGHSAVERSRRTIARQSERCHFDVMGDPSP
jgi:hypothetical protein